MMIRFFSIIFLYFWAANVAYAKIHFKDVTFEKVDANLGRVEILFNNDVVKLPWLKFEDRKIHLFVPESSIKSKVVKKLSLGKESNMTVVGEQFSKKDSRLSMVLPYSIKGLKGKVHVNLKGKKILLNFPLLKVKAKKVSSKDAYDENYLQQLLNEKNVQKKKEIKSDKNIETDVVKSSFSSVPKKEVSFSLGKQVAKFAIFLVLVLGIFYGIVLFIKKSVLSKNKLGFLNSTKVVEVINTTYIAPKRSILLIRAHKQVFLIGSSEKGLHSLGELSDITGLMKEGERAISGNNFDISLDSASQKDKEFNLKEIMNVEMPKKKEQQNVRLSEQIKNKIKGLKSLQ